MPTTVKIEEADAKDLRKHAELLGLEAKSGMNRTQLIALLKRADAAIAEIPVEAEPQNTGLGKASAAVPIVSPAPEVTAIRGNSGAAIMPHFSTDPKVELTVNKTSETYRSKDVTVGINGDVFRLQRGQRVAVPYRVYLALLDAKEHQAVDTGEENMGVPVRDWQEVQSYPFNVHEMPSEDEIAAFHARTDGASASLSRAQAA